MSKVLNYKLDLNGKFFYIKDAQEKFEISKIKSLFENDEIHESMSIPANWELCGLHNYNGTLWFIKKFDFEFAEKSLTLLKFLGVDYLTEVWLNWNYLGKHEGYFSPFSFNISQFIKNENIIAIKVTSSFEIPGEVWPDRKRAIKGIFSHHDCRPGGNSKEYGQDQNTGGIWNDIFIEFGYNIVLDNVKISSSVNEKYSKAYLTAEINYTSIEDTAKDIPLNFEIVSSDNKSIKKNQKFIFERGSNKITYYFEIDFPLLWWSWDLGDSNLYNLIITSNYFNSKKIFFGIRDFHLDENQQFFINGKKLFLRGTNIIPTQFLSDFDNNKIKKIVSLMKQANINIVRIHAHVNREEFYEECSRQGILVWQDFSLQWTYDESTSFKSGAIIQIKEMVNHLYNHASIAVWCCHNEPGDQIFSLDPLLEQAVYSEDITRIVRRASNYEEHAYDGWYWGKKDYYAAAPMGPLVTEFGAQALPSLSSLKEIVGDKNLFPPDWKVWEYHNFQIDQTFNIAKVKMGNSIESFIENSQTYQAEVLKTAIDFYRRKRFEGINGVFQFMFIDCWPSISWSVIDYYGEKKYGYDVLKNCYQPVYVSVNVRQDRYFAGRKFLLDIFLINDLFKTFNDCRLDFSVNNKLIGSIDSLSLKMNQLLLLKYESMNLLVPESLSEGSYQMNVILLDKISEEVISVNDFNFSVVSDLYSL